MASAGAVNIDLGNFLSGVFGHPKQEAAAQVGTVAQANAAIEIAKINAAAEANKKPIFTTQNIIIAVIFFIILLIIIFALRT